MASTVYTQAPINIKILPAPFACKKGVIHIGAHRCEEASQYDHCPKVLWIDGNDTLCQEYPEIVNAIISDVDDQDVDFNITSNDAMSSSILPMKEHVKEHPDCINIQTIRKKTTTLDTLLSQQGYQHNDFDVLVMDIQGAEMLALKGARKTLPHIHVIVTEVNTKELYQGCPLIADMDMFLQQEGYIRVRTTMTHHGWGDAMYVRRVLTVRVHSGLGNRLFHLAFLHAIAKQTKSIPILLTTHIEPVIVHTSNHWKYKAFYDLFSILDEHETRTLLNFLQPEWMNEQPGKPGVYVDYVTKVRASIHPFIGFQGYFQSPKYFIDYQDEITTLYRAALSYPADHSIYDGYFLHVRGRDHAFRWKGMETYYRNALKFLKDPKDVHVFTDDPQFAKELGFTHYEQTRDDLDTMRAMISCKKGGICCNSTFSWWAAFLGEGATYIVPYPFNLQLDVQDIYSDRFLKHSILKDHTKSLVNARFVNNVLTMVFIDRIDTCSIDGVPSKCVTFTKDKHQDPNYNEFTVVTHTLNTISNILNEHICCNVEIYGNSTDIRVIHESIPNKHYFLVAMTLLSAKDLVLVPSYVKHYMALGVEHFYIYVNDDVPLPENTSSVTYIKWVYPYLVDKSHYAQIGAMTDFLYYAKSIAKYVLYNDVDEYLLWKPDIPLKQFLEMNANSGFHGYAFMNKFIKLHNPIPNESVYERITAGEYTASNKLYAYKNRSKCVIDPNKVDAMGVHCIMVPYDKNILEIGYATAELLHVCNFTGRVHVSVNSIETSF